MEKRDSEGDNQKGNRTSVENEGSQPIKDGVVEEKEIT